MRAGTVALAVALGLALPLAERVHAQPAHAQPDVQNDTITVRMKQGETLEVIAAEYYGDHGRANLIAAENKLKRLPHPGDRLKIPVTREITSAPGDTFQSLAQTYLGDESRAPFLAQFNAMAVDAGLPTGTTITIPFRITHVATTTESLANIASAYLDDPKQADLLRRYNNLDKNAIDKGESLIVPVLAVRVRAGKLPAMDTASKERRDQQREVVAAAASALPVARAAWLQGDFAGIRKALEPIASRTDYLETATAVEIGMLLGRAAVAFDDAAAAAAAFAQVLARQPQHELSAYADSPKVLDAWKKAGGHVQGK